jgi:CDP-6-deoxy-D-xylo-4-hexulose-3-dehydrase
MNDKEEFEQSVARYNHRRHGVLCHKGISPNFLALASTMSPTHGERCVRRGQEVITSVIGSSTILNAILRLGLTPVFVDVDIPTYNANPCLVEEAVNKDTGAILLPHTLGNPVSISYIEDRVIDGSKIWSIYDCKHAMGGIYTGTYEGQPLGSYGSLSTLYFQDRGMILTDSSMLYLVLSYVRRETGNNIKKDTEQIEKHPSIVNIRRQNWKYYHELFTSELSEYFILPEPHRLANPNWYGFALTFRNGNAKSLLQYLNNKDVRIHKFHLQDYQGYKVVGTTRNVDVVREKSFWLDVDISVTKKAIEQVVDTFKKGLK